MKDQDIGIFCVHQGFYASTSMGEVMFQFVGILSLWELEMIRERPLASLQARPVTVFLILASRDRDKRNRSF